MKKLLTRLSVLLAVMLLLSTLCISAFADDALTVNGEAVKKGDTVTFEYRIGGVSDPLEAAGANIEYDPSCLEYIDGSIGFDVFQNAMYNASEGSIYYSAIDVINGFDLKEEKMAVKLSFKVLDTAKGSMTITHTFGEIFTLVNEDVDLTENDYKANAITTVTEEFIGNDAPSLGIDANRLEDYQSSSETDFDNLMLGTDKDELISSAAAAEAAVSDVDAAGTHSASVSSVASVSSSAETSEQSAVQSAVSAADTASTLTTGKESSQAVSEIAVSSQTEQKQGLSQTTVVVVIAVVFVILLLGVIILTITKKKSDTDSEQE